MSADDALTLALRRDATARHNATITFVRVTGQTLNEANGTLTDTTSEIYSGACLILPVSAQEQTPEFGGEDINTRRYRVQIAANANVLPDDVGTVGTASLDDDLVGKELTVVDVEFSSRQVARNLMCLYNAGG